jgi:hypothetical protein
MKAAAAVVNKLILFVCLKKKHNFIFKILLQWPQNQQGFKNILKKYLFSVATS